MNFYKRIFRCKRTLHTYLDVSEKVTEALVLGKPVVALESTIITHGMPYPENERTALAVESIVREQGAVPATIGVINGRIKVGMNEREIYTLSKPDTEKVKISRRDFPYVLSNNLNGGTTVAGTLVVAQKVGINVFVTGGIGGVHRDVNDTMDISADLLELSRCSVGVVCSGVKSILDIARTLEFLETHGVCVVSYGDTKEFPAFYTRKSGHQSAYNVSNPEAAANLIFNSLEFSSASGILVGVPIPETSSFDEKAIQTAIEEALVSAKNKNISGKAVTPFVLDRISLLTRGKSLESNIALIKNNATIGSLIAVELSEKKRLSKRVSSTNCSSLKNYQYGKRNESNELRSNKNIVVIGGSMVDIVVQTEEDIQKDGRTLNGSLKSIVGGVGRNIADAIGKLRISNPPFFVSAVGDDDFGRSILQSLEHVDSAGVIINETNTTACGVILMDGHQDSLFMVADMKIMKCITPAQISRWERMIAESSLIVFDSNIPMNTMEILLAMSKKYDITVWFEPTDLTLASKPLLLDGPLKIDYISPNFQELCSMAEYVSKTSVEKSQFVDVNSIVDTARKMALILSPIFPNIIVTLGKFGLLIVKNESGIRKVNFYGTEIMDQIKSTSGAGDCFAAGYIVAMLQNLREEECVSYGLSAALQSLQTEQTVPSTLRYELRKKPLKYTELPVTGRFDILER